MTLAALETTLRIYLNEEKALRAVPVLRMLAVPLDELKRRAEGLAARLRHVNGLSAETSPDLAYVGGGSLPDQPMKTWVVEVVADCLGDSEFARRLRTGRPAVMARLRDGKLVLDVRTIFPAEEQALIDAVQRAAAGVPEPRRATP
jgi:L-seryl-tRNA(Ser) seleniumtransferase